MSKKIVHELSVEELVAIAQGGEQAPIEDEATEASRFIYECGIKHGDTRVSALVIYQAYKDWKGWDQKHKSRYRFFRDFKKHFSSVRAEDGMYYLLNPDPFDLTQEHYFQLKVELRRERTTEKKRYQKRHRN